MFSAGTFACGRKEHPPGDTDPDTLASIVKAIDPRIRAIVDWGELPRREPGAANRLHRKLLPYAGLISAKVDRFDAEYVPAATPRE